MGHYGEVFEVVALEAYVPRMVEREYALEDDPGSFLGPGWEEETPEAEPFQEPQGSLTNRWQQQLPGTTNSSRTSLP